MSFCPFSYRAWAKKLDWKTGSLISDGAVHDGDSSWFIFDRGTYEYQAANCRLWGVNAYELNDPDEVNRERALHGRAWLRQRIEGKQVFVLSRGLDKYGRPLVIIWENQADFGDNLKSVNKALLDTGLAVAYMGELI